MRVKTRSLSRTICLAFVLSVCFGVLFCELDFGFAKSGSQRFSEYEIRVIRPKFVNKRGRFELGVQFLTVMNDTFVYTIMASGIVTYHFTENFGFESALSIGQSIDRAEKDILFDDFEIKTEVFRTLYAFEGALLYTPIYGKLQGPEGKLVYFDTYFALGGGITGVDWQYNDFCQKPDKNISPDAEDPPTDTVINYPGYQFGIGQRIFYTRTNVIKWDLRQHSVIYNTADSSCTPDSAQGGQNTHNSVTVQIGASKFF